MSDILTPQSGQIPIDTITRHKDLGDSSHAPVRATVLLGELVDGSIVRIPFDFTFVNGVLRVIDQRLTVAANGLLAYDARMEFDSITRHLETISTVHEMVHAGRFFDAAYMSPHGAEIANDATFTMLLRNGASQNLHWDYEVNAGGTCELELILNPTITNQGTIVVPAPLNEVTTQVTTATVTHTPTVTGATGTERLHGLVAGGTGPKAGGGQVRAGSERILGVNEDMFLRLTNRSGASILIGTHFAWYEVPA